jgi:hypothetical protein
MSARFAGSQRLGDRRRRRLAVEADEGMDSPDRTGTARSIEGAHTSPLSVDAPLNSKSPISRLIPAEWWKYLLAAIGLLATSASLLVAGWKSAELTSALGPGFERLFALPDSAAVRWFSGVLHLLSAELALLIWWARSKSQSDYDGRYWLWIRVACIWLISSACLATGAPAAICETIHHFRPDFAARMLILSWLAPAAVIGAFVAFGLVREMRDCRWSRALLLLAAGAYVVAAGLALEFEAFVAADVRLVTIQGSLLAGHVGLVISMSWHARHVLHCTAEPAARPVSTWRIPRPHFRLPRLPRFGRKPDLDAAAPGDVARNVRRKRPAKSTAADPQPTAEATERGPAATSPAESSAKPQIRIDARHDPSSVKVDRVPQNLVAEAPVDRAPADTTTAKIAPRGRAETPVATPSRIDPAPAPDRSELNAESEELEEPCSKPDMRGLSKKQRRRLMQELRDRERAAGR